MGARRGTKVWQFRISQSLHSRLKRDFGGPGGKIEYNLLGHWIELLILENYTRMLDARRKKNQPIEELFEELRAQQKAELNALIAAAEPIIGDEVNLDEDHKEGN